MSDVFSVKCVSIFATGYSQSQRLQLKDFGILQNTQISRLADIRGRGALQRLICM